MLDPVPQMPLSRGRILDAARKALSHVWGAYCRGEEPEDRVGQLCPMFAATCCVGCPLLEMTGKRCNQQKTRLAFIALRDEKGVAAPESVAAAKAWYDEVLGILAKYEAIG